MITVGEWQLSSESGRELKGFLEEAEGYSTHDEDSDHFMKNDS